MMERSSDGPARPPGRGAAGPPSFVPNGGVAESTRLWNGRSTLTTTFEEASLKSVFFLVFVAEGFFLFGLVLRRSLLGQEGLDGLQQLPRIRHAHAALFQDEHRRLCRLAFRTTHQRRKLELDHLLRKEKKILLIQL